MKMGFWGVSFVLCCLPSTCNRAEHLINMLNEGIHKLGNTFKLVLAYGVKCVIRIWKGQYTQRGFQELIDLH